MINYRSFLLRKHAVVRPSVPNAARYLGFAPRLIGGAMPAQPAGRFSSARTHSISIQISALLFI